MRSYPEAEGRRRKGHGRGRKGGEGEMGIGRVGDSGRMLQLRHQYPVGHMECERLERFDVRSC